MPNGGVNSRRDERERDPSCRASSIMLVVSLSNVIATTCQYEALKYLSFPVQTLGKCAKMIPVMIWGFLINQKRYGVSDVGIAIAVTAGCTIFGLYGGKRSTF